MHKITHNTHGGRTKQWQCTHGGTDIVPLCLSIVVEAIEAQNIIRLPIVVEPTEA